MLTDYVEFLIIIPTYKRLGPLRAAIRSALCQANVKKRIIVADDCPDGSAAEVVRAFPEVIYLKNPKPSGGWPGRVRNFAFYSSREMGIKADYVHFLDDDDMVPEGHYEFVKDAFVSNSSIGVIFGLLRPFCAFSEDPARRRRQELQLQAVRNLRINAGRFPWFYHQIGVALKMPIVARWLYREHATFGSEMFLCSGGIIRYQHVVELRGFPDIRITQDYFFYTDAIRKFGCLFIKKETAGYGVGDTGAIWNPLDLDGAPRAAHTNEWMQELRMRQRNFRVEMGVFIYYPRKIIFRVGEIMLNRGVFPMLDRWEFFAELYRITDPDRVTNN